jgi:hypothetical protein
VIEYGALLEWYWRETKWAEKCLSQYRFVHISFDCTGESIKSDVKHGQHLLLFFMM